MKSCAGYRSMEIKKKSFCAINFVSFLVMTLTISLSAGAETGDNPKGEGRGGGKTATREPGVGGIQNAEARDGDIGAEGKGAVQNEKSGVSEVKGGDTTEDDEDEKGDVKKVVTDVELSVGSETIAKVKGSAGEKKKSGKTLRLTLQRAMKMARERNLDLKSMQLGVQAAEQGVRAAWGGLGPRLSFSAGFSFMGGDSAFSSGGGESSPFCDDLTDPNCINQMLTLMCGTSDPADECVQYLATSQGQSTARIVTNTLGVSMSGFGDLAKIFQANTFTPSVTAVWPVFNAASWLGIKQAKLGKKMSKIQVKEKVQDVGLQVQVAFLQILQFQELLALAESSAKSTIAHWKQSKALMDAGSGTRTDVLRWEAQIEQDKLNVMKMNLAVRQMKMMLNNVMGRPLRAGLELIPPAHVTGTLPKSESISSKDIDAHPQLKLAKSAVQGKKLEHRMAQSRFLPTLTLTANYQWQRYIQYLDDVPDRWLGSWMVGINLNVPIFDSLTDYHSVKSKAYEVSRSRIEEQNLRRMLRHQFFSAKKDLASAKQQVATSEKQVELSVEAHRSAENLYRAGAAKTTDLLDAQIQERQARGNLISSRYDYLIALARLERAAGKIRIKK